MVEKIAKKVRKPRDTNKAMLKLLGEILKRLDFICEDIKRQRM